MRFLWIVIGILVVLWLLSCIRLGVYAAFGEKMQVDVLAGPVKVRVFPSESKKEKKTKPKAPSAEKKTAPAAKQKPKFSLADIKSAADMLIPPVKRALERTRRSIRVKPLDLSVTVGGEEDPASAAELYGYIHMGVWTGMPVLEQLLVIPDPHIHVGIDFQTPSTKVEGEVGVTIRLGTVIAVAFGIGIPAVKWFLQFKKKQDSAATDQAQATQPAA